MARQQAILAGGCFWGMQELFRIHDGVEISRVGYTGGDWVSPTYADVKQGRTGHAEALQLYFDDSIIQYRSILELFFQIHDPTTIDSQGNDRGSQYRSAIFYTNDAQHATAIQTIADIETSKLWPGKIATQVLAAGEFWPAEQEHQHYLQQYPNGYTCHFLRKDWTLS